MRDKFRKDVEFWVISNTGRHINGVTKKEVFKLFFMHMPVRALFWFRASQYFLARRIPLVPGYIRRMLLRNFGLGIPPDVEIEGGLYIPHTEGVTILAHHIGERCTIVGSATIGKRVGDRGPTIGDDVYIGAGARVLGPIHVGNGAKIGANAVVINDVPAGATVVGVPGRILKS